MAVTTFSSRTLNQDIGRVKRATADGPVVITDRGRPAHVVMRYDDYRKLLGDDEPLSQALSMPDSAADDPDTAPISLGLRPVDFD